MIILKNCNFQNFSQNSMKFACVKQNKHLLFLHNYKINRIYQLQLLKKIKRNAFPPDELHNPNLIKKILEKQSLNQVNFDLLMIDLKTNYSCSNYIIINQLSCHLDDDPTYLTKLIEALRKQVIPWYVIISYLHGSKLTKNQIICLITCLKAEQKSWFFIFKKLNQKKFNRDVLLIHKFKYNKNYVLLTSVIGITLLFKSKLLLIILISVKGAIICVIIFSTQILCGLAQASRIFYPLPAPVPETRVVCAEKNEPWPANHTTQCASTSIIQGPSSDKFQQDPSNIDNNVLTSSTVKKKSSHIDISLSFKPKMDINYEPRTSLMIFPSIDSALPNEVVLVNRTVAENRQMTREIRAHNNPGTRTLMESNDCNIELNIKPHKPINLTNNCVVKMEAELYQSIKAPYPNGIKFDSAIEVLPQKTKTVHYNVVLGGTGQYQIKPGASFFCNCWVESALAFNKHSFFKKFIDSALINYDFNQKIIGVELSKTWKNPEIPTFFNKPRVTQIEIDSKNNNLDSNSNKVLNNTFVASITDSTKNIVTTTAQTPATQSSKFNQLNLQKKCNTITEKVNKKKSLSVEEKLSLASNEATSNETTSNNTTRSKPILFAKTVVEITSAVLSTVILSIRFFDPQKTKRINENPDSPIPLASYPVGLAFLAVFVILNDTTRHALNSFVTSTRNIPPNVTAATDNLKEITSDLKDQWQLLKKNVTNICGELWFSVLISTLQIYISLCVFNGLIKQASTSYGFLIIFLNSLTTMLTNLINKIKNLNTNLNNTDELPPSDLTIKKPNEPKGPKSPQNLQTFTYVPKLPKTTLQKIKQISKINQKKINRFIKKFV